MSFFSDITTCIKSRQFEKAADLLKANRKEVDGRATFKFTRSLATNIDQSNINEKSVKDFIQGCCASLDSAQDLTADDTEFTQGVLSLYHLVRFSISSSGDDSETCVMLSKTFLSCLRKLNKSLNGVESIAANFFYQVWNFANKVNSEQSFIYKGMALTIFVYGGSTYWNRLIDKLSGTVQESNSASFQMTRCVFDEFVLYWDSHTELGSHSVTSLLQVWTFVVTSSKSYNQHQDCTTKLRLLHDKIQESKEVSWLIDLVLSLFGASDKEIEISSKKVLDCLARNLEIVLMRIVFLALNATSLAPNQCTETKSNWKNQFTSIVSFLLHFSEKIDQFVAVVEEMQMKPVTVSMKCLTRACLISNQLLKLDPSMLCICHSVFDNCDNFHKQGMNGHLKDTSTFNTFLSTAETVAHNAGVFSNQRSDFINSVIFFRKALHYCVSNPLFDGGRIETFVVRFTMLYDARKATRDWNGVVDDFQFCLLVFYNRNDVRSKICCRSQAIQQHLFLSWSRFKRDIYYNSKPNENHLLELTILDVFKKINLQLDSSTAWELLVEEFESLDRRKWLIPKPTISAIAWQASALAKSSLQKGVASYLSSREGVDFGQKHAAAKRAVSKLATQIVSGHSAGAASEDIQGQVYLALAYLELYVTQQELLKKKTEKEMESLGPLIQSSTNVEVPPGEDASSLSSDGTSVDAVSYSYLKLELELKNQELMVKSLVQWEELVQCGWHLREYRNSVFNCLKSLGYFFSLYSNSFYSARAWSLTLKLADLANCDEELVLAASELLKLGSTIEIGILDRCHSLIENKTLIIQDQINFLLSTAWSKYFQHKFTESLKILDEQVFQSSAMLVESPSKSVLLLISQANLLRCLLAVTPPDLSHIPPSDEIGPIQAGLKAAQTAFTALRCYVSCAQQQPGLDFYGQEWNALRHFLVSAINVARIYLYTATPREARFFLKEALNAAQKHVSVLRTAEALLELCNVDLIQDNTMDCQSKLILICHLMGVAPPVIIDVETTVGAKKSDGSPTSPVDIRRDRRRGISSRKVPEIPIQLHQDATHRELHLPFNHQGASPNTKAREVSGGIFPEHSPECTCLTCSSELVTAIRCATLAIQAKLWSCMGLKELATEDFLKGSVLIQSVCARLKITAKPSSKRLFELSNELKISEMWTRYKVHWFQPPIITCLELLVEYAFHQAVNESSAVRPIEYLAPVKAIMYELYLGPTEHRAMKLTSAMVFLSLQPCPPIVVTPGPKSSDEDDDDVVISDGGLLPKTPALSLRKPIELPAPRRLRRNLMATKIDDTITIDDDNDSDEICSRRLGKPKKAVLYSSDSDSDVIPPSPPLPVSKGRGRTRAVVKNKTEDPHISLKVQPVEKRYSKRTTSKVESNNEGPNNQPTTTTASEKTKSSNKVLPEEKSDNATTVASCKPRENKFFKSKATRKSETEEAELSNRLAATKIDTEENETPATRPKRTTRSTRK